MGDLVSDWRGKGGEGGVGVGVGFDFVVASACDPVVRDPNCWVLLRMAFWSARVRGLLLLGLGVGIAGKTLCRLLFRIVLRAGMVGFWLLGSEGVWVVFLLKRIWRLWRVGWV